MKHAPDYVKGNTVAASVILSDPEAHPVGLRQWAERWTASHPPRVQRWARPSVAQRDGEQLALFEVSEQAGARA